MVDFPALVGANLGTRVSSYDERDVILYALAVGAQATDLDLVFERDLRVLPTFGLTLGLWVADAAGALGAFVPSEALHGSQRLEVRRPLPTRGDVEVRGTVSGVWDKARSTVIDVVAHSDFFDATYSIVVLGRGGWGGDRGPSSSRPDGELAPMVNIATNPEQAALYRLTGDRHLIHIDPAAAQAAGFPRPILHGLCTLGVVARELARPVGAHPCDLTDLEGRFLAPVLPGDILELRAIQDTTTHYEAVVAGRGVIAGRAAYAGHRPSET